MEHWARYRECNFNKSSHYHYKFHYYPKYNIDFFYFYSIFHQRNNISCNIFLYILLSSSIWSAMCAHAKLATVPSLLSLYPRRRSDALEATFKLKQYSDIPFSFAFILLLLDGKRLICLLQSCEASWPAGRPCRLKSIIVSDLRKGQMYVQGLSVSSALCRARTPLSKNILVRCGYASETRKDAEKLQEAIWA